jgi:hypothetical protein
VKRDRDEVAFLIEGTERGSIRRIEAHVVDRDALQLRLQMVIEGNFEVAFEVRIPANPTQQFMYGLHAGACVAEADASVDPGIKADRSRDRLDLLSECNALTT